MGHARARKIPAQLVEDEEYQLRYERVAGIDIAKAKADVCTRLPPARNGGRRASRLEEVPATAREILALAGRLLADGVELVVMEATAGCLHHHPRYPQAAQPVRHAQQRPRHRGVCLHLLQPPSRTVLIGNPDTAHQLRLADI